MKLYNKAPFLDGFLDIEKYNQSFIQITHNIKLIPHFHIEYSMRHNIGSIQYLRYKTTDNGITPKKRTFKTPARKEKEEVGVFGYSEDPGIVRGVRALSEFSMTPMIRVGNDLTENPFVAPTNIYFHNGCLQTSSSVLNGSVGLRDENLENESSTGFSINREGATSTKNIYFIFF